MRILNIFLCTQIISACLAFPYSLGNEPKWKNNDKPLILTPLIESGEIKRAQDLSRVHFEDFNEQVSYSGFFTVNKAFDSNMFFWYFPCEEQPESAPVLLWLQGGPGCSSLYGLFEENGPFVITESQGIEKRNYSWTRTHNVIYLDNPVGVGFSYTGAGGCARDETEVAKDLYEALQQFFRLFPSLQENEFYVSGESYAGKYVPAVSYLIHTKNPTAGLKINLKGLAMGNGDVDPERQLNYADYFYQIGIVDVHGRERLKEAAKSVVRYIRKKEWLKASNASQTLGNLYTDLAGFENYYNYLRPKLPPLRPQSNYLNTSEVRSAIHVGDKEYISINYIVYDLLNSDLMKSMAPLLSKLLTHYRVMTYNGQLDMCVAYPLTVNYLKHLNFSGAEEYKIAKRYPWRVRGRLAGFVKQAGNLTEVMVRNAGHMVPADQPEWAVDLITKFTHHQPFY